MPPTRLELVTPAFLMDVFDPGLFPVHMLLRLDMRAVL